MLRIQSSSLQVDVLPEVGGKVGQIRDRPSGRELLIAPQKPYRTIPPDGEWIEYDTSGMDDCFPNIGAGPYPADPSGALQLRDLGEWTHGCWDVVEAAADHVVLERPGHALPYFARKTVRFAGERTVEFAYFVENRGTSALRYMWAAHPLIAVEGPFEVKLPPGDLTFRTFPTDGKEHVWPQFDSVDLSHEWIQRGKDLKVFVSGLTEGWCELRLPEHILRFTFDLSMTPVVGVWFNHFGFPAGDSTPFRCVAVEPCTSSSDVLDELPESAYSRIEPGGSAAWSLRLEIGTASPGRLADA